MKNVFSAYLYTTKTSFFNFSMMTYLNLRNARAKKIKVKLSTNLNYITNTKDLLIVLNPSKMSWYTTWLLNFF